MRFRLPGTLLRFTDFQKEVQVDAPTLKAAIDFLVEKHPDLGRALYDRSGNLRATHRFFVNGEQIPNADAGRAVASDDVIDVITAVTGG